MNKDVGSSIEKLINQVINPLSNKTLSSENRLKTLSIEEKKLTLVYDREGISPEVKRKIENNIIDLLKEFYLENQIFIKTISGNSRDVFDNVKNNNKFEESKSKQASLKIGHGSLPKKRRIKGVKNIIAISSCKGGVGKSTFTANLAIALKNMSNNVGIIDADIYGPSMPALFNLRNAKPVASKNNKKKIAPLLSYGISLISFGLFIPEVDPVIWRGPMLNGVINQFLFDVDWGELDYLLIDLPPGTGDTHLSMIQNTEIDKAIVLSTPQTVALIDTKKGFNMFRQLNIAILGMIENMSYFVPDDSDKKYYIFGKGGVKKATKELSTRFLGEIPFEISLREESDNGNPYMNHIKYKGRPVWDAYVKLSKQINDICMNKELGIIGKIFNR